MVSFKSLQKDTKDRFNMLLRFPYYLENFKRDQPYNSLLLISANCFKGCPGCQNNALKDNTLKEFSVDELVTTYKNNPFVQGITLGGLEAYYNNKDWWEEFDLFLELANVNKLTIYTFKDKPYRDFNVKTVYWKTGEYINTLDSKVVNIDNFKITLASSNQNFIRSKSN